MNKDFIYQLSQILSHDRLLTEKADCHSYGYDNSKLHAAAEAVVMPVSHAEVAAVVALCNQHRISLVARGRGTGTVGGAVPIAGGLVMSFERMNSIKQIDALNRYMVVEPGVTNEAVQRAAKKHGFFWPPDPSSAAFCTVAGNLAYNSAGPRAVKYGTARENTLGLKVVCGNGKSLKTGTLTTKGVVGYDLTRLLIGSEGTLAITTEATLKLTPLANSKITMQAAYSSFAAATAAVTAIMAQPVTPCALEFMDKAAIEAIRATKTVHCPDNFHALLMIELDGEASALQAAAQQLEKAARQAGCLQFSYANTPEEVQALWAMRKALSPALRKIAPKKINEDVVVPVANMPALIHGVSQLAGQYKIKNANFGHAGNGNIHVNLLVNDLDKQEMQRAEQCLQEIFSLVLELNGTLSGEHGVGLMKQPYIDKELDNTYLELMQQIKQQFDPQNILNPGKIAPSNSYSAPPVLP